MIPDASGLVRLVQMDVQRPPEGSAEGRFPLLFRVYPRGALGLAGEVEEPTQQRKEKARANILSVAIPRWNDVTLRDRGLCGSENCTAPRRFYGCVGVC